jgi:hypothetical protein
MRYAFKPFPAVSPSVAALIAALLLLVPKRKRPCGFVRRVYLKIFDVSLLYSCDIFSLKPFRSFGNGELDIFTLF